LCSKPFLQKHEVVDECTVLKEKETRGVDERNERRKVIKESATKEIIPI
jgi:hypothetical protein